MAQNTNQGPKTLLEAVVFFADYEHCHKFMMAARWPDGIVTCPTCGSDNVSWLAKARVWKCYSKHERPKFSLKVGTIFEDSPISLSKWMPTVWLLANCKNGISSYELHRALGVTQKTAWFMLHRVRKAMQNGSLMQMGGNEIEVDESFIGGKMRNMHKRSKRRLEANTDGKFGKTIVLGILDRNNKQVRTAVIPDRTAFVMRTEVVKNVQRGATVYSDEYANAWRMDERYVHQTVNHLECYVDGKIHTNGMENFWSLLKRGLHGTYIAVEPFHLFRYVDEQAFRYNYRKIDDAGRFESVLAEVVGKRITYKQLTGKDPVEAPCA